MITALIMFNKILASKLPIMLLWLLASSGVVLYFFSVYLEVGVAILTLFLLMYVSQRVSTRLKVYYRHFRISYLMYLFFIIVSMSCAFFSVHNRHDIFLLYLSLPIVYFSKLGFLLANTVGFFRLCKR
jgi:hypothetical protein